MSVIAPNRAAKPQQRKNNARLRRLYPYFLIGPAAVLTLVFLVYPVGSVFYYSLQHSNVTQPWNDGFAGLDNFVAMGADPLFWRSLTFTLQWVVVEVGLQFIFGLALALLINKSFIGRALARSLVFSPWAVSGILTTTIWILIYNPSTGIGRYLADVGIGEYGVSLLSGSGTTFWAVVLAEMWKGISLSWPTSNRCPLNSTNPQMSTERERCGSSCQLPGPTSGRQWSSQPCFGRYGSSTTLTCCTR
jgi:multiple sugar transport system permease protein